MCGPRVHPRAVQLPRHSLARTLTHTDRLQDAFTLTHSVSPRVLALRTHAVDGSCCKSVLESLDPISAPSLLCYLLSSLIDLSSSRRSFLSPLSPLYISTLFSALNLPIQDRTAIDRCIFSFLRWSKNKAGIFGIRLLTSLPETQRRTSEIISFLRR